MPRTFTFGAGNARKVLRVPLYALGGLASLVVPRSKRLWVVGSGVGIGEGAVPFYLLARATSGSATVGSDIRRIVWLASSEAELADARSAGFDTELKAGARGFWLTLRARVLVVTHGFGDVNRYGVRGGFVLQLWHGIPLKKLHLDSPAALRVSFLPNHLVIRSVMSRAYRAAGRQISLFPVASELVASRIVSAFGVPSSRVVVTGDVRDDVLLRGDPAARIRAARELVSVAVGPMTGGPVLLYAPTWRDGARDPGSPSGAEWDAIAAWLEANDAILLVRAHPLGLGDYLAGPSVSDRIRMLGSDLMIDVTPALAAVDTLITDYSSIAFDHALTGGRAVFFAPDLEAYAKSRGMYQPYRDFSGGRHATDWAGVLEWLDEPLDASAAHTAWLSREHVDRLDGHAAERVLAEVLRRIGDEVPILAGLDAPAVVRPVVTSISVEGATAGDDTTAGSEGAGPVLVIGLAGTAADTVIRLDGGRASVVAELSTDADGELVARLPLSEERWGDPGLALPSGEYRLLLTSPGAEPSSRLTVSASTLIVTHPLLRADVTGDAGGLSVRVSAPLADDERGPRAQRRLEDAYHRMIATPQDAVFFESFYGRSVTCNPLAIDRALARTRPDITRYWSVIDASIPVPEGSVRIIEGSRDWWRARASSRLLVVNDWLRKRWKRRRFQRVLQTWHGTMLKKLALDRTGRGLRTRIAILRERDRWDLMLAQNDYAVNIFRSAYAFSRTIWDVGYPRNDVIAENDPFESRRVRARLGVATDARIVLYAPTWRDDRTEMVDYLDLENFASELEPGTTMLVRGHSRTLPFGRRLEGERLLDVTSYPNMSELLLVADVLVTDYSSVMFDFASTERPLVLFAPDLEHYSEDLRGFYFDLASEAPGPVLSTREELLAVLRDPDAATASYAERRVAWRARFAPHDDGGAADRVVQRILSGGLLG